MNTVKKTVGIHINGFEGLAKRHNSMPHVHGLAQANGHTGRPAALSRGFEILAQHNCEEVLAFFRNHKHYDIKEGEVVVSKLSGNRVLVSCAPDFTRDMRPSHFSLSGGEWYPMQAVTADSEDYKRLHEAESALTPALLDELSEFLRNNGLEDTLGICFAYGEGLPGKWFVETTDERRRLQMIAPGGEHDKYSTAAAGSIETYWAFNQVSEPVSCLIGCSCALDKHHAG